MRPLDLPARPNLAQYKKQSKDLLRRARRADADALQRMRHHHPRVSHLSDVELQQRLVLADAQLVVAREHGFDSWPKFAGHVEDIMGERLPAVIWRRAEEAVVSGDAATLERLLRDHGSLLRNERPQSSWLGGLTPDYSGADARAIIVGNHGFDSWEGFAVYERALADPASSVARFEAAVDAIVSGDASTLKRLLDEDPALIRVRSLRSHRSTLLHYVGSNGVEGFRQRTPKNAGRILTLLLDAGAEVDARADMYRGTTTLGLVATSIHPVQAGVLEELIDILLGRGAFVQIAVAPDYTRGLLVNACLVNGRPQGAELLARRGAPLDLEGAAGVGALDVVKSFFEEDGRQKRGAASTEAGEAVGLASEYGRTAVVEFLLDRGVDGAARLAPRGRFRGHTPLHLAALGGHVDTVRALIRRGLPVAVKDDTFGTTPLGWALYSWHNAATVPPADRYYEVVELLIAAGARIDAQPSDAVRADKRMLDALAKAAPER